VVVVVDVDVDVDVDVLDDGTTASSIDTVLVPTA